MTHPPAIEARMDPEEWRAFVSEVAKAIAPGWERQRARIEEGAAPLRDWMIRELAPRPEDTLLELAAGAGDTGFEAAALAGESGRLISTDVSPEMVEVARRRGAELQLRNVDYQVMDAERLELEAGSVDGVICRFGYMLMADPAAAIAETRRVLRREGRLVLAVWGVPESNPWLTMLAEALIQRGHVPPPQPGTPSPFSMASDARARALLEGAGFAAVRTEEVPVRFAFRDIDDYMSYAADTAGPLALVLRGLPTAEADAVKTRIGEEFGAFAADGGYALPGVALAAVAS